MTCHICGVETEGSRGPATGILRPICLDCGARVDGTVLSCLEAQSRAMEVIFEGVDATPLITEAVQ